MTLVEKQQLQKLIQKLPPRNLDRVVEIICRSKPAGKKIGKNIHVDLEKEVSIESRDYDTLKFEFSLMLTMLTFCRIMLPSGD